MECEAGRSATVPVLKVVFLDTAPGHRLSWRKFWTQLFKWKVALRGEMCNVFKKVWVFEEIHSRWVCHCKYDPICAVQSGNDNIIWETYLWYFRWLCVIVSGINMCLQAEWLWVSCCCNCITIGWGFMTLTMRLTISLLAILPHYTQDRYALHRGGYGLFLVVCLHHCTQ